MPKHTIQDLFALINDAMNPSEPRESLLKFLKGLPNLANAPASGALRYHHAYEGGLVDHIIETYSIMQDLNATRTIGSPVPRYSRADMLMVAVLHDIHKVQDTDGQAYYVPNILKSGKRSEAEPYAHNDMYLKSASVDTMASKAARERDFLHREAVDGIPGGVKSLALIWASDPNLYNALGEDVHYAIRYHDGAYGHNKYELAGKENPLMILFHCADMLSSRLNRVSK